MQARQDATWHVPNITGNAALAWGLVAAGQLAKLPVFLGATRSRRPATSSTSCRKHKNFGVRTFQAEDEIAAVGMALGAAFGGHSASPPPAAPASP